MRFLYVIFAALILSSCSEIVEGEGDVISRDYKLKEFHSIVLDMHGNLNITQGEQNISVTTNENIYEWLDLYVSNGVLYIELRDDVEVWHFDEMRFDVSLPFIRHIELDGAGDISIGEFNMEGKDLELELDGAGDIAIENLVCKNLNLEVDGVGGVKCHELKANNVMAEINGAGNIRLSGSTPVFGISIDGTGNINCFELSSDEADVDINGAGNCHLKVNKILNVDIDGTGSVFYKGNPEINISTNGLGTVNKVD